MKKTVLAIGGALMLFANTLKAEEQSTSFGVKAGGSCSFLQGLSEKKFSKKGGETSPRILVAGGLNFGYNFLETVGVGIEVLYASLGAEISEKSSNSQGNTTTKKPFSIKSQNLCVPVTVKIFPIGCDPEEGILNIHVGVQGNLSLAMEVENDGKKDDEFKDKFINKFTVDAVGGIGYQFPEIGLTLEGRYNFGFMDIFKKDDEEAKKYKTKKELNDKKLCNQFATVSLGYDLAPLLLN